MRSLLLAGVLLVGALGSTADAQPAPWYKLGYDDGVCALSTVPQVQTPLAEFRWWRGRGEVADITAYYGDAAEQHIAVVVVSVPNRGNSIWFPTQALCLAGRTWMRDHGKLPRYEQLQ